MPNGDTPNAPPKLPPLLIDDRAASEEEALLAIDTDVVDTLIQVVLDAATVENVKLPDIIQFGQLLMERRKVGPFPPAMKDALLTALNV